MDRETKIREHFEALSVRTGLPAEYLRFEALIAFWRARLRSLVEAAIFPKRGEPAPGYPREAGLGTRIPFDLIVARIDATGRLRRGLGILGKKTETAWLLSYHGFDAAHAPRPSALSLGGVFVVEEKSDLALLIGLLRSRGEKELGVGMEGEGLRGLCPGIDARGGESWESQAGRTLLSSQGS